MTTMQVIVTMYVNVVGANMHLHQHYLNFDMNYNLTQFNSTTVIAREKTINPKALLVC
jgi:hypothetical protein